MIGCAPPGTIALYQCTKETPAFLGLGARSPSASAISSHTGLTTSSHRNLSNMNTLPTGYGGPSLSGGPDQYSISNTRVDNNVSNSIHGHSNQNVGNMSNCYNNTINVGASEESLRIQAWLSPLEPGRRHQESRTVMLGLSKLSSGQGTSDHGDSETWRFRNMETCHFSSILHSIGEATRKSNSQIR